MLDQALEETSMISLINPENFLKIRDIMRTEEAVKCL